MADRWDCRKYGTESDPIRQSDLAEIAGSYSCSKRLAYRKELEASGQKPERDRANYKGIGGTAVHEAIHTYLTDPRASARILRGELPSDEAIASVICREMERAANGLIIDWYGEDPVKWGLDALAMAKGALADVGQRAADIVASEADFLAPIECDDKTYWLRGTMDLVYRSKEGALVLADWKTGEQRQPQVVIDHGYQLGIYAHALRHGALTRGDKTWTVGQWPDELYIVHLRDHVPYQRATSKTADRAEEAAFWGVQRGEKVKLAKGDRRGPAWYSARRTEADVARLKHSIRKIVGGVRLGILYEHIGNHCGKCSFSGACLSDGHAVSGNERKQLESALSGLDLDGLDEVA